MKTIEIAERYGFDWDDFQEFLRTQNEVMVYGFGFDNVHNEDVERVVRLYSAKKRAEKREIVLEKEKRDYAQSVDGLYEYDVVTVLNIGHGQVDKNKMMDILASHARGGWRLHTIYSNEFGKNAISILGIGGNSTASEDVMIFERKVQSLEE